MDEPVPSHPPSNVELKLRCARIDLLRTNLEIGLTLLSVAERTGQTLRRHRQVLRAIGALEIVHRYSGSLPSPIEDVHQRYEELRERLLMMVNGRDPGDKS